MQRHKVSICSWKNGAVRPACFRVAINLQFAKNSMSEKCSKISYENVPVLCTHAHLRILIKGVRIRCFLELGSKIKTIEQNSELLNKLRIKMCYESGVWLTHLLTSSLKIKKKKITRFNI